MRRFLSIVLVAGIATTTWGDDARIRKQLSPFGITHMEISASPIDGLRTVLSDQGVFYASEDGNYFLQGSLVKITPEGPKDLSNLPLMGKLEAMSDHMIVFAAEKERHIVTVFTDTTCPYCQALHKAMQKYNDLGITVRYLAFPRNGIESKAAREMESIWTSADPKAAFTAAQQGDAVAEKAIDLVAKQYALGVQFGVRGTPAIVLESGRVISGFVKPAELLQLLRAG